MKHIIIGDVHGMYSELSQLLDALAISADDKIVFAGDLVGRGPASLQVMQCLYAMRSQIVSVLGNHDLHAVFMHASRQKPAEKTRLAELLSHPQADEMLAWMRTWPLMHTDHDAHYCVTHAGVHPDWRLDQAASLATATTKFIKQQGYKTLSHGYGNSPDFWDDGLVDWDRARFVINAFTRMRYLDADTGSLEFSTSCHPEDAPAGLVPWFMRPTGIEYRAQWHGYRFFFGHWAALRGEMNHYHAICDVHALDTGCVWGGALTAYVIDAQSHAGSYVRCADGKIYTQY